MNREIDCRGLNCPQPVINTKKALDEMKAGSIITIVDNEVAKENVKKLAQKMNTLVDVEEKDGNYYITLTKGEEGVQPIENIQPVVQKGNGEFVILIGNDKMGTGEEELGNILIKGYLYTMTEVEPRPDKLIFVNNGVKLACIGSPSIEHLKRLEEMGVEIMSCGTCLDYYHLKEQLQVGNISNMYTIVESLHEAGKSIVL